jgi:hypothetical protein
MLRIYLRDEPVRDRPDPWARCAPGGRVEARGDDVPERWPADAQIEIVLAARHARMAALDLPPMPADRLLPAARYALDDQMATTPDDVAIAVNSSTRPVLAAIASAPLVRAIAMQSKRIVGIVAESALAPRNAGWTWCASAAGGGLVRRDDGSAFAVGAGTDAELPSELLAALALAKRAGQAPAVVHAALRVDGGRLDEWSHATGVPFVAAPPWHWSDASPDAFAAAPDLLDTDATSAVAREPARMARLFRPALLVAALAAGLHGCALLTQWIWVNVDDWRASRALVREASGLPNAATPSAAAAAIAQHNAELRHRDGRSAPGDALPLLARAAPSIAALPRGALKSASYAGNAWTLELANVDAEALSRVSQSLGRAGVEAVSARTSSGARMRLTLDPAAR